MSYLIGGRGCGKNVGVSFREFLGSQFENFIHFVCGVCVVIDLGISGCFFEIFLVLVW